MKIHPSHLVLSGLSAMTLWILAPNAFSQSPAAAVAAKPTEFPVPSDAETLFTMGRAYAVNEGGVTDYPKAVEYLSKAAELGHAGAQNVLGALYGLGQGVPPDNVRAAQWFQRAAEQGLPSAEFNYALCWFQGKGVAKDTGKGIEWLTKAAEGGMPEAQARLGNLYFLGGSGVSRDMDQAFQWTVKAARAGIASAQNTLGFMFENGRGCKRDGKEAMRNYALAAEQGIPKAQSNLGRIYASNSVVPQNKVLAYKWLKLSANQREITALNYLKDFQLGLKPEEIAEGERLVKEFQSEPKKRPAPSM